MKVDNPDEYVVLKREELVQDFAESDFTQAAVEQWIDEHEVPLMTLPQIEKDIFDNTVKWFPEMIKNGQLDLTMVLMGLAGEAGECADTFKKYIRRSLTAEEFQDKLTEETIDLLHYIAMIWIVFQRDPSEEYRKKTALNEQRFGSK